MLIHVGCEFVQRSEQPVHTVLQVDGFGNLCRRLTLPAGRSVTRFDAHADVAYGADEVGIGAVEIPPELLPDPVLSYTLPSRFCPSDELGAVAWDLFGTVPEGWIRAQAISDWVHEKVRFDYTTTVSTGTALDVFTARTGVCRDFAHLGIALCRALSIPARYAFGYLPDIEVEPTGAPMDFCAWTEVYLSGRWWTLDPRNGQPRIGRVLIGRGRDALDVAMVSTFGAVELESMLVWADPVVG